MSSSPERLVTFSVIHNSVSKTFSLASGLPSETVRRVKQVLARPDGFGIPVSQCRVLWAQTPLGDDDAVSLEQLASIGLLYAERVGAEGATCVPPTAAGAWQRPPHADLLETGHAPRALADPDSVLSSSRFFVWCTAARPRCFHDDESAVEDGVRAAHLPRCESAAACGAHARHRSIGCDSFGTPYPPELQPGSVRPYCKSCGSELVLLTEPSALGWEDLVARRARGECQACQDPEAEIGLFFVCRGTLTRPTALRCFDETDAEILAPLHVCHSDSRLNQNCVLLGVCAGGAGPAAVRSLDTGAADPVQIEFAGCAGGADHRLNANGLAAYLGGHRGAVRRALLRNTHRPELLGAFGVRCAAPGCAGILHGVGCRPAGDAWYYALHDWVDREAALAAGSVLCPLEGHRVVAASGHPGPCQHCTGCDEFFCEQHGVRYNACPHSAPDDQRVVFEVRSALARARHVGCPGCGAAPAGRAPSKTSTNEYCGACQLRWCFFCRSAVSGYGTHRDGWQSDRSKCPTYIDEHPLLSGTPLEGMALFFRARMLRELRGALELCEQQWPGRFAAVYPGLPEARAKIAVVELGSATAQLYGPEVESVAAVTLEEIVAAEAPCPPYAMP